MTSFFRLIPRGRSKIYRKVCDSIRLLCILFSSYVFYKSRCSLQISAHLNKNVPTIDITKMAVCRREVKKQGENYPLFSSRNTFYERVSSETRVKRLKLSFGDTRKSWRLSLCYAGITLIYTFPTLILQINPRVLHILLNFFRARSL